MINSNTLNRLEHYGFGADIDAFESYVLSLQDAAGSGNPIVTDSQYDDYIELLKEVKPESVALNRNWEKVDREYDDNDTFLKEYGMKSIRTIREVGELEYFKKMLPELNGYKFCASAKINGYGVRAVYRNGVLVSGSTRGRYKKGRDITRHLKRVLPDNISELASVPIAEVRGELYVSFDNFELLKHKLKTPLSAVTSMSKESATDSEIDMLSFRAYQIFGDGLEFDTLSSKFTFLVECGFKVPYAVTTPYVSQENFNTFLSDIVEHFEEYVKYFDYDTDGVVVAIDDVQYFNSLGAEGNTMLGNFALKIGHWESNVYSSVIESIEWCYGKKYITPKAHVQGVITRNGSEVKTVPLYNVGVMQDYGYYPGKEVFFRYGGETGVTLTDAMGNPVGGR